MYGTMPVSSILTWCSLQFLLDTVIFKWTAYMSRSFCTSSFRILCILNNALMLFRKHVSAASIMFRSFSVNPGFTSICKCWYSHCDYIISAGFLCLLCKSPPHCTAHYSNLLVFPAMLLSWRRDTTTQILKQIIYSRTTPSKIVQVLYP